MKLAFMCHPVRVRDFVATEANLARAKLWLRWATLAHPNVAVVAPYIPMCEVMDDVDPAMRARGIATNLALIERCDEVWLCGGRISAGMQLELEHARAHDLIERDFTQLGEAPPTETRL